MIDGTQAAFVRVPNAENSLYKVPNGVTEDQAVKLSDILPTGFEIGVQNGQVKPGDVVAGSEPGRLACRRWRRLASMAPRRLSPST
ncbi:hypothetical protein [Cryobacterium gelidum]|uniref:hypothetical protein n=1 Tax=Cryobacterium gelidum TaxID=1259164 RepID=UPI0030B9C9C1